MKLLNTIKASCKNKRCKIDCGGIYTLVYLECDFYNTGKLEHSYQYKCKDKRALFVGNSIRTTKEEAKEYIIKRITGA